MVKVFGALDHIDYVMESDEHQGNPRALANADLDEAKRELLAGIALLQEARIKFTASARDAAIKVEQSPQPTKDDQ